jgi:hypothetical protein
MVHRWENGEFSTCWSLRTRLSLRTLLSSRSLVTVSGPLFACRQPRMPPVSARAPLLYHGQLRSTTGLNVRFFTVTIVTRSRWQNNCQQFNENRLLDRRLTEFAFLRRSRPRAASWTRPTPTLKSA